MTKCLEADH